MLGSHDRGTFSLNGSSEQHIPVATMPVNRAAIFQLGLLLLIVPVQYIITQWKPVTNTERTHNLQKLMLKFTTWKNKFLSVRTWRQCYDSAIQYITGSTQKQIYPHSAEDDTDTGESPAVEVLQYKDKSGHFAGSTKPRSPRSSKVKFRVGQVIRHKIWGYRGVIVGWDETAKAPEHWIKEMHGKNKPSDLQQPFYTVLVDLRDNGPMVAYLPQSECDILSLPTKHWRHIPSYSVLVDTRDRQDVQTTYVVEENIEIIRNTKIIHPEVDEYFEKFDGTRYLARPWLKKIYPHDQ